MLYRIPAREPWMILAADVLTVCARVAGTDPHSVLHGHRSRADRLARELVVVACRRFRRFPMSWPEIGAVLHGSNSTGMDAWRRFQRRDYAEREAWLFVLRCEAAPSQSREIKREACD